MTKWSDTRCIGLQSDLELSPRHDFEATPDGETLRRVCVTKPAAAHQAERPASTVWRLFDNGEALPRVADQPRADHRESPMVSTPIIILNERNLDFSLFCSGFDVSL